MTEDQRFAAQRPDVLVYTSPVLDDDLTVAGPIGVKLSVSTSGTDSDFVVKVIDVYPGDYPQPEWPSPAAGQPAGAATVELRAHGRLPAAGARRAVPGEVPRRFREAGGDDAGRADRRSTFDLPDVYHVFRRGHRVMVQIQSSWFPLVDRNPQQFIEIPKARPADFQKAIQRVFHGSTLSLPVVAGEMGPGPKTAKFMP